MVTRTGCVQLDDLIDGIPLRSISQIAYRPTAGGMTLILRMIASLQQHGGHVVLVDSGTSFDGGYASDCGVTVDELILVEVQDEGSGLDVLVEVVSSQRVDLLVMNLMMWQSLQLDWRKVLPVLWDSSTAVVILTRPTVALPVASLHLEIIRQCWLKQSGDIIGCMSQVTVERNRHGITKESVLLPIVFGKGQ